MSLSFELSPNFYPFQDFQISTFKTMNSSVDSSFENVKTSQTFPFPFRITPNTQDLLNYATVKWPTQYYSHNPFLFCEDKTKHILFCQMANPMLPSQCFCLFFLFYFIHTLF